MADFSKVEPSGNLVDRTGDTARQKAVRETLSMFDPVTALRNVRSSLIEKGVIAPATSPFRRGLPKAGGR